MQHADIHHFKNISQLMRFMQQPAPVHPLIALVDYSQPGTRSFEKGTKISLDFYKISFKHHFAGQVKYGQGYYDFEEGGLAFLKPRQVVTSPNNIDSYEGYALYFHPDFIRNYPLGNSITKFGFFSYATSEALFLSAREKDIISNLFDAISKELDNNTDQYSQDILVSQIELLLNHSHRFYNRQFITRKIINHEIIAALDKLLDEYFDKDNALHHGLPSVQYISETLHVSPRYLGDLLRSLTGRNTQQYIQDKVIELAKDLLGSTALTVAEIAYRMGFEHPQSFSKLFKSKLQQTPLEFRQKFN
ncbi:MAG: AraC family transcriptional regulator [Chitinophaga sp.]|uniref:helix-turn-helix domain-containing protein n=1 Tax=Chitinophaga sp. TaxID=1869181 RepID=UPI001B1863A9|nr:AraC family transcriptional regulator [Chitinophaga sp.]MBO9729844.1 AraC family transcriptional regulator [Chitinophaga sp.]